MSDESVFVMQTYLLEDIQNIRCFPATGEKLQAM